MSIKLPAASLPAAAAGNTGSDRHGGADEPRDMADHGQAEMTEAAVTSPPARPREIGGPPGPEPTRYGDWQFNGRVTDF